MKTITTIAYVLALTVVFLLCILLLAIQYTALDMFKKKMTEMHQKIEELDKAMTNLPKEGGL